jgi:putative transposase
VEESSMQTPKPYPTNLTDAQWNQIAGFFSERPAGLAGRPRKHTYRQIVNAILYLLRTGCPWRLLPHDFPPYSTVSDYYHQWRKSGLLERMHDSLRAECRKQAGKEAQPSVGVMDTQSVHTTEKGGRRTLRKLSAMMRPNRSRAVNATLR